jgi:hypothetical protein
VGAGGNAGKTPAFFCIENVDQPQQLAGAGRQMCGHFGDLVTEAGEVLEVLEIGILAGAGQVAWKLPWEGAIMIDLKLGVIAE